MNNVRTSVRASSWLVGGRLLGFGWMALLLQQQGVGFFGRIAVVLAVAALIAVPLDAYYVVRTARVPDEQFAGDQAARVAVAMCLTVVGAALWPVSVLAGFAVVTAGCEMAFNAYKSRAIREGRPDLAVRDNGTRQAVTLVATAVAAAFTDFGLGVVGLSYVLGYLPFVALALRDVRGARPCRPEVSLVTGALLAESLLSVAYLQGDVVLLNALASDQEVGYYAMGVTLALAAGAVGQSWSQTFHGSLRASGGDPSTGPPPVTTSVGAAVVGAAVLALAAVLVWSDDGHSALAVTLAVSAGVCSLRFVNAVLATILVLQSRDYQRLRLAMIGTVVKLTLIALLAGALDQGALGAAVAFLVAELVVVGRARKESLVPLRGST